MTEIDRRPLRADAQRNRGRILEAARQAFDEHGPHLALDEIAKRAEVSPATLYRHFANRDELVVAVMERRFAEDVEPVIVAALAGADPWKGLVDVIGATLRSGSISPAWREAVAMTRDTGLARELARDRFHTPVGKLLARAQVAGVVRADVDAADITPIIRMLRALVTARDDVADDVWLRYLSLILRMPGSWGSDRRLPAHCLRG